MNKKILFIPLCIILLFTCLVSQAQIYNTLNHPYGTQNINGNNVTITTSGNTAIGIGCGGGIYWVSPFAPGSFTFTFEKPAAFVSFKVSGINDQEIISFKVNGIPYTLTAGNLFPYLTCYTRAAIIAGGNLAGPVGGTGGNAGAGAITISGNINSIEIHGNGLQNGSTVMVSFWYVHASSNTPVCTGKDLQLYATPDIPGAQYSWSGPNNFSSNLQNPIIPNMTAIHEGIYTVTVTTSEGVATDTTLVTMLDPKTTITYNEPACTGQDIYLAAQPALSGMRYQWEGPAGFRSSDSAPVIPQIQPYHFGLYTLITTVGNCTHKTEREIIVHQSSHTHLSKIICSNEPFLLNGNSLDSSGIYHDTLVTIHGCDSIITVDLVVLPAPTLEFIDGNEDLCMGDTVLFTAGGAARYEWYNNSQRAGYNKEQAIALRQKFNKIAVVGIADNECRDTLERVIQTHACCEMFVPNAFSPNGDGNNDDFAPRPYGNINVFQMQVFNRWGQLVFSSYDINNPWDGKHNGQLADIGTYHYYLTAWCLEGTEIKRKGSVTLIR